MLVSVIIPVYNVEKYIEKCILSVINNNLQVEDYEIIVVDDESPDQSVSVIRNLMVSNNQIKLISQVNKGLGGARNTGVNKAKGDYVLFLDADDYLKKGALKKIVNFAIESKLDILEFGAIGVTENGDEVYRISKSTTNIMTGYEYLNLIQYMNSACNKLYATQFLKTNQLEFVERIFIEDFEFNTRAFYYARKVQGTENILGCFVQTANSITRNTNKEKNQKMILDIKNVIDLTIQFSKNIDKSKAINFTIIDERIGFLTTTLLYTLFKLNIKKNIRRQVIKGLQIKNLYPINTRVRDNKKNVFKFIANNEFIFNICCGLKQYLLNKNKR